MYLLSGYFNFGPASGDPGVILAAEGNWIIFVSLAKMPSVLGVTLRAQQCLGILGCRGVSCWAMRARSGPWTCINPSPL